jgi:hypothetical protein
MLGEHE